MKCCLYYLCICPALLFASLFLQSDSGSSHSCIIHQWSETVGRVINHYPVFIFHYNCSHTLLHTPLIEPGLLSISPPVSNFSSTRIKNLPVKQFKILKYLNIICDICSVTKILKIVKNLFSSILSLSSTIFIFASHSQHNFHTVQPIRAQQLIQMTSYQPIRTQYYQLLQLLCSQF